MTQIFKQQYIILLSMMFLFNTFNSAQAQFGNNISSSLTDNILNRNNKQSAKSKIQKLKTVFISKELSLQPSEYEDFWGAYSFYEERLNDIWDNKKSDKASFDAACKQLQKDYSFVFQKILGSPQRAEKVYEAEAKFRNMLRNELKNRKE